MTIDSGHRLLDYAKPTTPNDSRRARRNIEGILILALALMAAPFIVSFFDLQWLLQPEINYWIK